MMVSANPITVERQMYADMLGITDTGTYSLAELRDMTAGGVNAHRAAKIQSGPLQPILEIPSIDNSGLKSSTSIIQDYVTRAVSRGQSLRLPPGNLRLDDTIYGTQGTEILGATRGKTVIDNYSGKPAFQIQGSTTADLNTGGRIEGLQVSSKVAGSSGFRLLDTRSYLLHNLAVSGVSPDYGYKLDSVAVGNSNNDIANCRVGGAAVGFMFDGVTSSFTTRSFAERLQVQSCAQGIVLSKANTTIIGWASLSNCPVGILATNNNKWCWVFAQLENCIIPIQVDPGSNENNFYGSWASADCVISAPTTTLIENSSHIYGVPATFKAQVDFDIVPTVAGVALPTAPGGPVPIIYNAEKIANTVRNNVGRSADADLAITLPASSSGDFELYLPYTSSTTADISVGFSGPAGCTVTWNTWGINTTATTAVQQANYATQGIGSNQNLGGTGNKAGVLIKGHWRTGLTSGPLTLEWGQANPEISDTTLHADAFMKVSEY